MGSGTSSDRPRQRGGVAILVYNIDAAGGMERQAARLAERFAAKGRRVVIVSTFFPASGWKRLVERRRGVLIYRVPCFSHEWHEFPASQELYEALAAWLLHRHAAWLDTLYAVRAGTCGLHAARLAPVLERPAVLKLACSGLAGDFHAITQLAEGPAILERLRGLDRVIHLNDASKGEALDAGLDPARLARIPNGIDVAPFGEGVAPAELPELGPREKRELVLFVGRLDEQKRVHVLIEAFARVARRRSAARLAIVGEGPLRPSLEALARERGLADRVLFTGVRRDVPSILRAASAFVLPSAEEGISNALLEALASSVPSIATAIPGNVDVLRHEREGLLVPVDDTRALEHALERLLADRPFALALAAAGRARVEEVYDLDHVAERYLALFDSLGPRPRPSLARFLRRRWGSDVPSLTGYLLRRAWATAGIARSKSPVSARGVVTCVVVGAKRLLGIEGPILGPRV